MRVCCPYQDARAETAAKLRSQCLAFDHTLQFRHSHFKFIGHLDYSSKDRDFKEGIFFATQPPKHLRRFLDYGPTPLPYLIVAQQHICNPRQPIFNVSPSSLTTVQFSSHPITQFMQKGLIQRKQYIPEDANSCPLKIRKGNSSSSLFTFVVRLLESRRAATHDLALTNQLCVEFGPVKCEVNVEVYTVEGSLWSIHPLEVLLEVFAGEI